MGKILKKVKKKIVTDILPSPSVAQPEDLPEAQTVNPITTPDEAQAFMFSGGLVKPRTNPSDLFTSNTTQASNPDPVVSDPVPVEATPTETQETAQAVQRKKKGRKPLINTSSTGLGGSATVYTPTLLG